MARIPLSAPKTGDRTPGGSTTLYPTRRAAVCSRAMFYSGVWGRRSLGASALALLLSMVVVPVYAAEPSAQSVKLARDLGNQGVEAYQSENYAVAEDRLERAYQLYPNPTLGLWSARALTKNGKLVEASERYTAVARMELEPNASDAFREAVAAAAKENAALAERIPKLFMNVTGAPPDEVSVTVDGVAVPSAMVGVDAPMNPGQHEVRAEYAGQELSQRVSLADGQRAEVILSFSADGGATSSTTATKGEPFDQGPPEADTGSGQRTLGWVGIGIGGAGLVLGGVTGMLALGKRGDLEDQCPNGVCPESARGDHDSYNQMRTFSTIGFVVGVVGVGAGAVLLATAPSTSDSASVSAYVGLGSAGVRGSF